MAPRPLRPDRPATSVLRVPSRLWFGHSRTTSGIRHWLSRCDAPLLKNGGLITTEVTGDGQPDFIWATPAADQVVNGVVSSDGGAWQSVAFGTNLMVDTLTVSGGILTSSEMTCDPNCAEGGTIDTSWRYDRASRTFIGTDITPTTTRPPSPACTANAIADTDRESPDVGAVVTFSVQDAHL